MQELIAQVNMSNIEAVRKQFEGTLETELKQNFAKQLANQLIESNLIEVQKYVNPTGPSFDPSVTFIARILVDKL